MDIDFKDMVVLFLKMGVHFFTGLFYQENGKICMFKVISGY